MVIESSTAAVTMRVNSSVFQGSTPPPPLPGPGDPIRIPGLPEFRIPGVPGN